MHDKNQLYHLGALREYHKTFKNQILNLNLQESSSGNQITIPKAQIPGSKIISVIHFEIWNLRFGIWVIKKNQVD